MTHALQGHTRRRGHSGASDKTWSTGWGNIYFCFIDYAKAFNCVDHNKLWKILKEMGIPTTLPAFWEICKQVKKQQLELDMEQTASK